MQSTENPSLLTATSSCHLNSFSLGNLKVWEKFSWSANYSQIHAGRSAKSIKNGLENNTNIDENLDYGL